MHFTNGDGMRACTIGMLGLAMKKAKGKKAKALVDGSLVNERVAQSCWPSVAPCWVIPQYDAVTPALEVSTSTNKL